jgi:hypothetical protein
MILFRKRYPLARVIINDKPGSLNFVNVGGGNTTHGGQLRLVSPPTSEKYTFYFKQNYLSEFINHTRLYMP